MPNNYVFSIVIGIASFYWFTTWISQVASAIIFLNDVFVLYRLCHWIVIFYSRNISVHIHNMSWMNTSNRTLIGCCIHNISSRRNNCFYIVASIEPVVSIVAAIVPTTRSKNELVSISKSTVAAHQITPSYHLVSQYNLCSKKRVVLVKYPHNIKIRCYDKDLFKYVNANKFIFHYKGNTSLSRKTETRLKRRCQDSYCSYFGFVTAFTSDRDQT